MALRGYLIRRIIQVVPVLIFIIAFNFLIIYLAPGDPALVMAGEYTDPVVIEAIRQYWGLDKPFHERLITYVSLVLRGDLGYSYAYNLPVVSVIGLRVVPTLLLVFTGQSIGILLGILLGVLAAWKYPSKIDRGLLLTTMVLYSLPSFWFGLMLILAFSLSLGWFPSGGMTSIGGEGMMITDTLWHMVLPVATYALVYVLPVFLRLTRASVMEVISEDFITTARAKGLRDSKIYIKHAFRNAVIPVVTMAGLNLGHMLSGTILVESVFSWPGMGRLMYTAILNRDQPILMGIFLVVSISVVLSTLLTDLTCAYLDPRISYE